MNTQFEKTSGSEDYITPKNIMSELGHFDIDPCASKFQEELWADKNYTITEDGLKQEWTGRVWCNPPYGNKARDFIKMLAVHGNGIALIFARMDTKLWHEVILPTATAIFVFKGRINFLSYDEKLNKLTPKGPAGTASCLVIYGKNNLDIVANTPFKGEFLFTHRMIEELEEDE